ncbi:MAG: UbiA family prenyltransferase [Akkermansiaceae bacterium]|nr:UbiA family prenyltransferase [Akkermansiaceae bacterium]
MNIKTWATALRVRHWIKSGFCLAALFFHGNAFDLAAWRAVLPMVAAFSLVSSAGYLLNDIVNRLEDRRHPRKRHRPIAAGLIGSGQAWIAIALLVTAGLAVGFSFYGPGKAMACVGGYLGLTAAYSLWLRGIPVVDVLAVAAGFAARVAAGSYALQSIYEDVYPTPWLLVCTYFLAMLIGFGKRKGEEALLVHEHQEFGPTRKALRGYRPRLLNFLTAGSAALAGGAYVMYCLQRPEPVPFVLSAIPAIMGLGSYLRLAWRSSLVEMPEFLLLRDPVLTGSVALWVLMVALFTT